MKIQPHQQQCRTVALSRRVTPNSTRERFTDIDRKLAELYLLTEGQALTQEEIAEYVELTPQRISQIERSACRKVALAMGKLFSKEELSILLSL